jgi:hypothetical protein
MWTETLAPPAMVLLEAENSITAFRDQSNLRKARLCLHRQRRIPAILLE